MNAPGRASPRPATSPLAFAAGALAAVAGVWVAFAHRFVLDDAFISFRYAEHLAGGHGFVWNVGEAPIEGVTNYLWTIVLSFAVRAGWSPETTAQAIGLACFAGTLLVTRALAWELTRSHALALAAATLAAMNPTLSAYATSGLETSAQVLVVTSTLSLLVVAVTRGAGAWSNARVAWLSLLPPLAVAIRPDSLLLYAVVGPVVVRARTRDELSPRRLTIGALASAGGLAALALTKWTTFGTLVPNTFYAKVAGDELALARGFPYVVAFGVLHGALPLGAAALGAWWSERKPAVAVLIGFSLVWLAYIVAVGADFMEFRFMAPLIPIGVALSVWTVATQLRARATRLAVVLSLALVFLVGWRLTRGDDYLHPALRIETIKALSSHIDGRTEDWRGVGRRLSAAFPSGGVEDGAPVTIAVTAAGALPYHARLRTIDMYGLNDREVAREGEIRKDEAAGHRRIASVPYLVRQGANLVFPASSIWLRGEPRQSYTAGETRRQFLEGRAAPLPDEARVVEIPLDEKRAVRALYLMRHPAIDARIATEGWRVFPIVTR